MDQPDSLVSPRQVTRRGVMNAGLGLAAAATAAATLEAASSTAEAASDAKTGPGSGTITVKDGTTIFYKDWGPRDAQPVVFHHGWPLSADDWDAQMMFFLSEGYRVIAHDRRGHGRSSQTDGGNEMDTYAADMAALAAHLKL